MSDGPARCPVPPRPEVRAPRVSLLAYLRMFRRDILSAQPARLYRAWMAEFRTPFFRSYMCNDPALLDLVLKARPDDFPKSNRIREGLAPLLGNSVFVTNGAAWKRQRRIIDPAFEGGRLKDAFPAMLAAGQAAVARMAAGEVEVEAAMSHAAADVIFRTLFSIPIEHDVAARVFHEFRNFQRSQPLLNLAAFLPLPAWMPRFHRRKTLAAARRIRGLIAGLTAERAAAIAAGTAPDDLATRIMTTPDPQDGSRFSPAEMADQVGIFLLAGHETSASALSWALYLMAIRPEWQDRVAEEARAVIDPEKIYFSVVSRLKLARVVFRETMRLYPPVPMYLREAAEADCFRDRKVPKGAQIVISPWHLHRHERLWTAPDEFDPGRWETPEGRDSARKAYIPFSAGPRVCPGSAFAMAEGPLILAMILRRFRVEPVEGRAPLPVAQLTVRGKDGIWLRLTPREESEA